MPMDAGSVILRCPQAARGLRAAPMIRRALTLLLMALPFQAVAAPHPAAVPSANPQPLSRFDEVRRAAEKQLQSMQKRQPKLDAAWREDLPGPALLTGLGERLDPARFEERGLAWAQRNAGLWGIAGADLTVLQLQKGKLRTTLRLSQTAMVAGQRLAVLQRGMALTIDADGQLLSAVAEVLPVGTLATPRIDRSLAQKSAVKAALGMRDDRHLPVDRVHRCELAILAGPGESRLVWAVDVVINPATDRRAVLVDAETGLILGQRQAVQH